MSTKKKPPLPHPIAKAVEEVFAAGHTPRIHVDARRRDVTVPDHVRERWQARLVIDLDPSWPLRLEHSEAGLAVDLAFSGMVSRCVFGWAGIYVVLDRATGRGTVIEPHLPPHELSPELAYTPPAEGGRGAGGLRAVSAAPPAGAPPRAAVGPNERPTLNPGEVALKDAPARRKKAAPTDPPKTAPSTHGATQGDPSAASSSEEQARERRARFRVIEGGG